MEDRKIVELYFARNEEAVEATAKKYGKYCFSISKNILSCKEDAEECVNDTYIDAWYSIPPHKPNSLALFLGKITRRIAIDRWRKQNAQKVHNSQSADEKDLHGLCITDFPQENEYAIL